MLKTIGASILIFISSLMVAGQKTVEIKPVISTSTPKIVIKNPNENQNKIPKPIKSVENKNTTQTKKVTSTNTKKTIIVKQTANQTVTETKSNKSAVEKQNNFSNGTINVLTRKALVNILCNTEAAGPFSPISGSGVVVSGNGIILTNAHVGQYFLLKDFDGQKDFTQCVIRAGNPAYPTYTAELLYIPTSWVNQNKTMLTQENPKGTGEHDYAFLRITGRVDKSQTTALIPFLPIDLSENIAKNNYTLLASYPAGFLGGQSILQDLFQSSSITTVSKVYTFGTSTIDLISVGGTIVSQKGSSGGAVVNSQGELVGLISTASESDNTSDTDLRAITTGYINRDLQNETGKSFADILSFPSEYAEDFNQNIAPKLTEIITNAILKK